MRKKPFKSWKIVLEGSPTPSGDLLAPAEIHALSPRTEAQVAEALPESVSQLGTKGS